MALARPGGAAATPMPPLPRSASHVLAALASAVLAAGALAQNPPPANDRVVELPEFTVTDSPVLPDPESWTYAQITGFEVLSSASDRETRRLLRDFEVFRQALSLAWPVPQRQSGPAILILCGGARDRFTPFIPPGGAPSGTGTASLFLRNREQVAIVVNLVNTMNLLDAQAIAEAGPSTSIPEFEVDAYKQLYREYVHFLLNQGESRPPPWLAEGVAQIVMDMEFTPKWVTFGEINSRGAGVSATAASGIDVAAEGEDAGGETAASNVTVPDQQFNVALARRALLPLDQMFAVTADSPEARNPLGNNRWAKQCYAFVHFCLYGDGKRWQKPFAQFLQRTAATSPTEQIFRECFGMTHREMLVRLRGYIGFTNHEYQRFVLKGGETFTAPPPELSSANEAQIARLKGDALRLAGHREAAHIAYRAAYIRGEREPRLLAALGTEEVAAGRADRGRKLLEAAARSGFDRPSAYAELARLRLAEASAAPAGRDGTLSPAQVSAVMEPLISAQRRQPPLPDTYALAASTWLAAEVTPPREQLRALDSGIMLFPRYTALILQAIELNVRAGASDHAARLARHGAQAAPDAGTRARFEEWIAKLPAPSAPAAEAGRK